MKYAFPLLISLSFLASACSSKHRSCCGPDKASSEKVKVVMAEKSGSQTKGVLYLEETSDGLNISGKISGLAPGLHGFHIHEYGNCSAMDASSAGAHFGDANQVHGAGHKGSHAGDLGNINASSKGWANISISSKRLCLDSTKKCSVRGRSIIVHEKVDDLTSQPAGNSGARIACGVIPRK